jgi:hypothetical protein
MMCYIRYGMLIKNKENITIKNHKQHIFKFILRLDKHTMSIIYVQMFYGIFIYLYIVITISLLEFSY